MNRTYQGKVTDVEIANRAIRPAAAVARNEAKCRNQKPGRPRGLNRAKIRAKISFDHASPRAYFGGTSLLSVSTAGRGAVSSETAPAFFKEAIPAGARSR